MRTARQVAADHLRTLMSALRGLPPSLAVVRTYLDRDAQRQAYARGSLSIAEQFAQEPPAHRAPIGELTGATATTLLKAAERLLSQLANVSGQTTTVGGDDHGPKPAA